MMLSRRLPTFDIGSHLQSVLASSALALACVGSLSWSLHEFFADSLEFRAVSETRTVPTHLFAGWKLSPVGDARTQLDELFFQNEWMRSEAGAEASVETPDALTTPVRLALQTRSSIKVRSARRPITRKKVPAAETLPTVLAEQTEPSGVEVEVSFPESDVLTEPSMSSALTAPVYLEASTALTVYRSLHERFGKISEAAFDHRAFSAEPQLAISTSGIDSFPEDETDSSRTVTTQSAPVIWSSIAVERSDLDESAGLEELESISENADTLSVKKPDPSGEPSEAKAISVQTLPRPDEIRNQRDYSKTDLGSKPILSPATAQAVVKPSGSTSAPNLVPDPVSDVNSQIVTSQSIPERTGNSNSSKMHVIEKSSSHSIPAARLVVHRAPTPVKATTTQVAPVTTQAADYSPDQADESGGMSEYSSDAESVDEVPFSTIPTRADQTAVFAETFHAFTEDAEMKSEMTADQNPRITIAANSPKIIIRPVGGSSTSSAAPSSATPSKSPSSVQVYIPNHQQNLAQTGNPLRAPVPFVPPAPPADPSQISPPKKVVDSISAQDPSLDVASLTTPPDFSFAKNLAVPPAFPKNLIAAANSKRPVTITDRNSGSDQSYRRCTLGPFGKRAISGLPVFQNDLMVCKRVLSFEGEIDASRTQWIEARIGEDVPGEYYPTIAFQKLGASDTVFGRIPMLSRDDVRQFELLTGIHVERELGIVMGEITDAWVPEWSGRAEPAILLGENFERLDAARGDRAKYFVYLNVKPGNNLLSMKGRTGQTLGAIVPIVRGGTVTYLKPPKVVHREVRVRVLDGMATAESGLSQVTVEVIGQPSKSALTRADGSAVIGDVTFFGDFPVYVDVIQSSRSYRHRFQISFSEAQKDIPLYHFDPQTVGHWLAQVDRGVSGESGLVVGVRGHQASTDAHSYLRLFRMDGAALLREDTYGIARDESLRAESQMSAETSRFLMVQVPEGMHVLGDFSEDSRLRWSETIIAQPGVINVTRPH